MVNATTKCLTMAKTEQSGAFNYHLLRNALNSFSKNIDQLSESEYQQVRQLAKKSYELETLVLSSPQASNFVVAPSQLAAAVESISQRYESHNEMLDDLAINGLDENNLRMALYRELIFDGVMQVVGQNTPEIKDLDIRLFYELHLDRFRQGEKRQARHILITVNEDIAENSRQLSLEKTQRLIHPSLQNAIQSAQLQ